MSHPVLGTGADLEMCLTQVPALMDLEDRLSHLVEVSQPAGEGKTESQAHLTRKATFSSILSSGLNIKYRESQGVDCCGHSAGKAGAELGGRSPAGLGHFQGQWRRWGMGRERKLEEGTTQ